MRVRNRGLVPPYTQPDVPEIREGRVGRSREVWKGGNSIPGYIK